jgi:hypothetical protein
MATFDTTDDESERCVACTRVTASELAFTDDCDTAFTSVDTTPGADVTDAEIAGTAIPTTNTEATLEPDAQNVAILMVTGLE